MHIEILEDSLTGCYNWTLCDGPDGIDKFSGFENTLGEVFEQIVHYRTLNALSYYENTFDENQTTSECQLSLF